MNAHRLFAIMASLVGMTIFAESSFAQYGVILTGSGPVNRSMGGASTATPLTAAGATYWNPATLPALGQSQLEASAELLFPHTRVESTAGGTSGSTSSDRGAFPLPTISIAFLPEDSQFSYGLGVHAVAGFGVDYAGGTNPIVSPPPPNGVGFGPIYSDYQVLLINPSVAYQLTQKTSVAVGPTLSMATLRLNPGIFAAPDDGNGNGTATYPNATHGRTTWGGGFTVGLFHKEENWAVGLSYKSPQWTDTFRYNSSDEVGRPRSLTFDLDLPAIISVGISTQLSDQLLIAADVRWIDYQSAHGFGDSGFNPDLSVRGLGFRSIFTLGVGAQYQMSDALSVRLGYTWSEDPIPNAQTMVNVGSPVIAQHMLTCGLSFHLSEEVAVSLAYVRAFETSNSGPFQSPGGPVAGTSVRNVVSADMVVFGATVKFGGRRDRERACNYDPLSAP